MQEKPVADILIENAAEIVTPVTTEIPGSHPIRVIKDGSLAVSGDRISAVGKAGEVASSVRTNADTIIINARGLTVLPGLIDPHTHTVFAGFRENEFAMRLEGRSYMEILEQGGGIISSVQSTRTATGEELFAAGKKRLDAALKLGITTIEIKSGYGLDTETEIKMLETINRLGREHEVEVVPTFMGAHAIPREYQGRRDDYVKLVIDEMIPEVGRRKLAKFCDVFCEPKVFTLAQTENILTAAQEHGMIPKLHADEMEAYGAAELGVKLSAISVDHLIKIDDRGIDSLAGSNTCAVLLPGTSFFLRAGYAPARKMLEKGVRVALATDFNPGSSCTQSLPLIMTIACLYLKMSIPEVIAAVTVNAAAALGIDERVGTLEKGKQADITIFEHENHRYIPYRFGDNFVKYVIKSGKIVVR